MGITTLLSFRKMLLLEKYCQCDPSVLIDVRLTSKAESASSMIVFENASLILFQKKENL